MSVQAESHPRVLLLSSRYDLTSDYVVVGLQRREIPYLRLNTEDFNSLAIELDPIEKRLVLQREDRCYSVTGKDLISVLFRRPVFLRDYGDNGRSYVEQFSRVQWSAFVRNLMIFDEARWINNPTATYRAEHKALQLSVAAKLGFAVPGTRITNAPHRYLPDRRLF